MNNKKGLIRVGRIRYHGNKMLIPKLDGYKTIVVMMKSHSKWYPLSPYELKNNKGQIMENIYQFSKVYKKVPKSKQRYSKFNNTIIWEWPEEVHVDKNCTLTPEYWEWREAGTNNRYAVRYPVGFRHRGEVLYSIKGYPDGTYSFPLDYINARKEIYIPEYSGLVKKEDKFKELKRLLNNKSENLLIVEVDGPHQESLDYYKDTYGVDNNFIMDHTMLINRKNIKIMLNDPKHNFGHGYVLAMTLLDKEKKWGKFRF
jgi:hypothetical protein